MCWLENPRMTNIVVHFKVVGASKQKLRTAANRPPPPGVDKEVARGEEIRQRGNFYIVKEREQTPPEDDFRPTFTVFPSSGNVTVTGIRHTNHLNRAFDRFAHMLDLCRSEVGTSHRLVNSTYKGVLKCDDDPRARYRHFCLMLARYRKDVTRKFEKATDEAMRKGDLRPLKQNPRVTFNKEFFPGVRIRYDKVGTISLFKSGNYVLVGVTDTSGVRFLLRQLCRLLNDYSTILGREYPCEWKICTEKN